MRLRVGISGLCLALAATSAGREWGQEAGAWEQSFLGQAADAAAAARIGLAGLRLPRLRPGTASQPTSPAVLASGGSSSELASCIRDRACVRLFLVAHRAKGFRQPDNSRAAFREAVEAGVPVIETDVTLSKDGEMFVLHGDDLDHPTRGGGRLRGKVQDFTAAELETVLLENGETLPRLRELYAIVRGRALLDVDFKHNAVEPFAELLRREGSFDDALFFVNNEAELEAAARLRRVYPSMLVMPRIRGWRKLGAIRRLFGGLPEVIHADVSIWTPVADLRDEGVKVFVKALDEEKEPDPGPLDAVLQSGADFILTNDVRRLRQRLLEKASGSASLL